MTDPNTKTAPAQRLLDAILTHVPFEGWTEPAFKAAIADSGIDPNVARGLFPRGATDLAAAFHRQGDDEMVQSLETRDMTDLRFRDRIALAVRLRLEAIDDKEAVRRGATLYALPLHAADGAKLVWGTADRIWSALGDSSDDVNWYTKRATLSAVYGSAVLFWLGDDSPDHQATWAFLDRRIDDVMQIEKVKAQVRDNKFLSGVLAGPNWLLGQIKAPSRTPDVDLPGHWSGSRKS